MKILYYLSSWLGISETFIYNQIQSVLNEADLTIIAHARKVENKYFDTETFLPAHYLRRDNAHFWKEVVARKLRLPGNRYALSASQSKQVGEVIEQVQPDLIHAHYGGMGLSVLPVARKFNLPLLTTFHGNDASMMLRKKVYLQSLRLLLGYPNSYVIAVSENIRRKLIRHGASEERAIRHYIGTDLTKFKFHQRTPIREKMQKGECVVLLQVSNFVEKKGHKYTIEALVTILEKHKNIKVIFAGDGPERHPCQEAAQRFGIGDRIDFVGKVDSSDVPGLMMNADIFIHNSVTGSDGSEEGIPTVLMEAMASGLPVLSTLHAGISELVIDGEMGFLAEERHINQYRQNIEQALQIATTDIGRRASQHVAEHFNLNLQNQKLASIYRSLAGGENSI